MSVLADALLKQGLVTLEQISDAKIKQIGAKIPIQDLLVEMGFIKEDDLVNLSAKIFNTPVIDLSKEKIDPGLTALLPYVLAKRYGVFPVRKDEDALVLAMSNPQDILAIDDIKMATQLKVMPILCPKSKIEENIEKYYQFDDKIYDVLKNTIEEAKVEKIREGYSGEDSYPVQPVTGEIAPVVRLCNIIITDAVKARASDIHIEAQENNVKVRYRIDGDLKNIMDIPANLHAAVVSRIKILSDLDIAENKKPQDGRSKILVNGRKIDLRVSTIPTFHGEKVEMRLLDPEEAVVDLKKIGFEPAELDVFVGSITKPQGIILVTGPTGSGKTSTLYAALTFIKNESKNIVTIEDPVEYLVEGINQMQINPAKNVTFATGLKSILRQDPNVILVGEIRDKDTADIAFQSSLTGHLVLSSLHTNSAVNSVTRLLDIGLEPYLIASSLSLILAQRLVKLICNDCKQEYSPDESLRNDFKKYIDKLNIQKFYRGKGCSRCGFTGYFGRAAIFEIMQFNEEIRKLIIERAPEDRLFMVAQENGLKPLVNSGMNKVAAGTTTLEEIMRVVGVRQEDKIAQVSKETGKKIRILIADDEEDLLKILEKRLLASGYDVIKARDGSEAVELAHKEKPDLIITDATMPKMNGFEAIKALRSQLETAVIPVIMLTARQDKESELKGIDAGADDYMGKPFDNEKLLARIKMLLARAQRGRQA